MHIPDGKLHGIERSGEHAVAAVCSYGETIAAAGRNLEDAALLLGGDVPIVDGASCVRPKSFAIGREDQEGAFELQEGRCCRYGPNLVTVSKEGAIGAEGWDVSAAFAGCWYKPAQAVASGHVEELRDSGFGGDDQRGVIGAAG